MKTRPIAFLLFMGVQRVSRMSCSFPFPGIEERQTSLLLPPLSFVSFGKVGVTMTFFQDSGTSPSCHDLSKIMESGLFYGSFLPECFTSWQQEDSTGICR